MGGVGKGPTETKPSIRTWILPWRRRGPGFGAPRQHPSEGRGLTALAAWSSQKSGEPSEREEAPGVRRRMQGGSGWPATRASLTPASHSPVSNRKNSLQSEGRGAEVEWGHSRECSVFLYA